MHELISFPARTIAIHNPFKELATITMMYNNYRVGKAPDNSLPLLHFACRENFVDLVQCLLKNGADIREK